MSDNWKPEQEVPAPLAAGVEWWLKDHPNDVVFVTSDGDDAMILSGEDAERVMWVDPEGLVRESRVRWMTVHIDEVDHIEVLDPEEDTVKVTMAGFSDIAYDEDDNPIEEEKQ